MGDSDEVVNLRTLIAGFVLSLSQTGGGNEEEPTKDAQPPLGKDDLDKWISDAASRVESSMRGGNPIKLATHTIKAIHPDAKGANLFVTLPRCTPPYVSSAVLREDLSVDVVGNAAYKLKQYKFLLLRTDKGERVIDLVLRRDPKLAIALGGNTETGEKLLEVFENVALPRHESSPKVKQLYWLVGQDPIDDDEYHLLAPLYATSLAHRVFQAINHDRFSEEAKEARKAGREGRYAETGYRDYPGLAVQKFGGTKPQNISQLNSERGGNNYLLASLPPRWVSSDVRAPLNVTSSFQRFGQRPSVRQLVRELRRFLESDPSATYETRDKRDDLNAALMDELMLFSMELLSLPPGWSAEENCRLPDEEQLWLDPGRAEIDDAFRQRRQDTDWPLEIRRRFALWLNQALGRKLPLGDVEHEHWSQALRTDASFSREMDRDQRWMTSLARELDAWQGGLAYE
ncbi:type I-F CRISPR-associated protein Csy1 [Aquisalimonas asiatica]|uniref:CRISPR-associated protein Csy1 n=1 Tax=Aquisalimonas asiatica TaxID=406100 RepID=A0A1H8TAU2_9GAMM|nr:type I-F CRISPR-associated protein Csy1 [Aquisalimonas asiatica]SEO87866.1 CRISPR-associated protein Csy1 [Aquisalimonas asiatica]